MASRSIYATTPRRLHRKAFSRQLATRRSGVLPIGGLRTALVHHPSAAPFRRPTKFPRLQAFARRAISGYVSFSHACTASGLCS
ncbi:MAG: hypothetical protein E5299_00792 [Burkholderia gladioli]|nr:MAG: hypothetical protein E5299_00792 [Burkholderia gladioli]